MAAGLGNIKGLIVIIAPHVLHRPPNDVVASVNALGAFALGHLMDRALGVLRRRKAAALPTTATRLSTPPTVKDVFP